MNKRKNSKKVIFQTSQYGNLFVLSWKLPTVDDSDNDNNEQLLEERTEIADKSLIAIIKIVCELKRASYL